MERELRNHQIGKNGLTSLRLEPFWITDKEIEMTWAGSFCDDRIEFSACNPSFFHRGNYIGPREIVSDMEQGQCTSLGQGICETIPKVETRRVDALSP